MAESQRRILPLPKRRVTSGTPLSPQTAHQQSLLPQGTLFSRLRGFGDQRTDPASVSAGPHAFPQPSEGTLPVPSDDTGPVDESEEDDEEEEEDECTGCRDWLENVKNKKKRKIPTSAVMGHSGASSSPVQTVLNGLSPNRGSKAKTRRRRTWDVSSEVRPDSNFRYKAATASTHDSAVNPLAESLRSKNFDFTCDSPVSRNLPAPPPAPLEIASSEPVSIATQTSPSLAAMEPILPPRHRRTREEKEYDRQRLLARQRREARAKLKPGEKESIWICQFCEFESVFGYAPLALISGYTERVRASRRAVLERKRLLEKARSKGKKKKKAQSKAGPPASLNTSIAPPLQNGAKTGIDKNIGPGSASCTCCDHRRDKEERERRHRQVKSSFAAHAPE